MLDNIELEGHTKPIISLLENNGSNWSFLKSIFIFHNLPREEGKEGEEAGALDRLSEFALMRRADAGPAMIADPSVRIKEATQSLNVFIIDVLDIVLAEVAKFHNGKLNIIN